jgi:glutaredoxin-like protein NrdH
MISFLTKTTFPLTERPSFAARKFGRDRRRVMTVKMYTLSTCGHCKAAKQFLGSHGVAHEFTDVDLLDGDARKSTLDEVRKYNPGCSFPTILIGERVIIGFNETAIREALGL